MAPSNDFKYEYNGPVFYYNSILQDNIKLETWANSDDKARSNILYQIKKKLGYDRRKAGFDIDDDALNIVDYRGEIKEKPEIKYCKRCGMQLNDSGECPRCDLLDPTVDEDDDISSAIIYNTTTWGNKKLRRITAGFDDNRPSDMVFELLDMGVDPEFIITMFVKWMPEDDIRDMLRANAIDEFFEDDEDYEDEEIY